jgi:hypothetical protein
MIYFGACIGAVKYHLHKLKYIEQCNFVITLTPFNENTSVDKEGGNAVIDSKVYICIDSRQLEAAVGS